MLQRTRPWLLGLLTGLVLGAILGAATVSRGAHGRGDADLAARVAALEALTQDLSRVEGPLNGLAGPHLIFEGVNVHVRSGSGATADGTRDEHDLPTGLPPTGLGNLIVGYNEEPPDPPLAPDDRVGSHNLIVGAWHRFANVAGLVAGRNNSVSGPFASVSGGNFNTASGEFASVGGGESNTASGVWASVSGGRLNRASGDVASVSGGRGNLADGYYASVSGGESNTASGIYASVSGGLSRSAPDGDDWAGGGLFQDN